MAADRVERRRPQQLVRLLRGLAIAGKVFRSLVCINLDAPGLGTDWPEGAMRDMRYYAADLEDACPGTREAALEKLKALYVRCEAGSCTLVPEVAGVALPHAHRALTHPEPGVRIAGLCAIALFAPDAEAAAELLLKRLPAPSVVLIKASRGVRAEKVVERLISAKGRAA